MRNRQSGFSLLEVMVVVMIGAILIGLGGPSLVDFVKSGRMTSSANDMLVAVMAGNAEAVKRRASITLCRSEEPLDAAADCTTGTDGDGWEDGWILFVDNDGDFTVDAGAGDEILLRHGPMPGTIQVTADEGLEDAMQFTPTGRLRDGNGFLIGDSVADTSITGSNLLLCDDRGNVAVGDAANDVSTARALRLSQMGRANIFRSKTYIDNWISEHGEDVDIAC